MDNDNDETPRPSKTMTLLKTLAACAFLYSAVNTYNNNGSSQTQTFARRRLTMVGNDIPSYMEPMMKDLKERQKLFDETPPEEVKYWFEYTGPLQVSFYFFLCFDPKNLYLSNLYMFFSFQL